MATETAVAAGANNGTSPPAPSLGSDSDDQAGMILLGSGATPTAGAQVVLTLGGNYSSGVDDTNGVRCHVTPGNAATAALGPWYATGGTHAVTFGSTVAPTASQGAATYVLIYTITS